MRLRASLRIGEGSGRNLERYVVMDLRNLMGICFGVRSIEGPPPSLRPEDSKISRAFNIMVIVSSRNLKSNLIVLLFMPHCNHFTVEVKPNREPQQILLPRSSLASTDSSSILARS